MYAKPLMYSLTAYECIRHHLRADSLNDRINMAIETYVPDDKTVAPCTGDIMCTREGVRHKAGCLGKVEPIDVFWKKVQRA